MKRDFLLSFIILFIISISVNTLSPACQTCHFLISKLQKGTSASPLDKILSTIGIQYCARKHIQDKNVCRGAVTQMIDPILNSLWTHYVDPHEVCHKLYLCPKEYFKRNVTEELHNIVKDKPNKEWEKATNRKSFKIMHISDLHPDFFYTPGAEALCSQPVCCRTNSTQQNSSKSLKAGYWGSLAGCDLPVQTFDLFLNEIKKYNLDFIIWTGDNTAHDIWQQTQSYNINFTTFLTQRIKKITNVTVIPAMGNHQSYPVNVYDYQGKRQEMLNQALAQNWKSWIGDKAYNELMTKGYYSVQLDKFNLKVISLNTQAGNDQNWFLLKNPTDPGKMLEWLQDELKDCEKKNQFAYIIGHIPPKSNMNTWTLRYNAIVDRYSYTIRGQFFGHSHDDHIGMHYSINNQSKVTNYYFIAPSLTTYSDRVPRYRILDVDFDTLQVKDFHQYRLDLRKYHKQEDNAEFQLLYNFKQAYGLDDLRPDSGMTVFINKLQKDEAIQKKYSYYHTGGLSAGKAGKNWYCDTFAVPELAAKCQGHQYKKGFVEKKGGQWKDLKHNG